MDQEQEDLSPEFAWQFDVPANEPLDELAKRMPLCFHDDPNFYADLKNSNKAVWAIARKLQHIGMNTLVRAQRIKPPDQLLAEYEDLGDIEILQRIEVKERIDIDFTSASDWPYPTMFVDVVHTWEWARPRPLAYLILNRKWTHYAAIRGSTWPHWTKKPAFDKKKNRDREFFECPLEHITWHSTGFSKPGSKPKPPQEAPL